ncbi:MAG: hypothetical protein QOI35_3906 [Cryptosporangiaceae bacterium]|jgi:hypothetical protein|nr:hypothetical protein [Cryptosporangiaceae bacterium]
MTILSSRLSVLGVSALALAAAVNLPSAATATTAKSAVAPLAGGRSAIYGGGPFYTGGQAVMNTLRSSGFTTVVLWTIHVRANGDLVFNDIPVVSNGQYTGDSGWPGRLATLKQAPTSVNRIEIGIGSWGVDDWGTIHSLITSQGTGTGSILYRNFKALLTATGADAINNDDETHYDVASTVSFGKMATAVGYKNFALAPYTNSGFWASVKSGLGSVVDRAYLQEYAGGAGNNPSTWNQALGMTVDPGLWGRNGSGCSAGDSPSTVQSKMTSWHSSAGIQGGFLWLFDDIQACTSQGTAADYAAAINNATGGGSTGTNLALNKPTKSKQASCSANEGPAKAVNGSVSGGTTDKWCSGVAGAKSLEVDLGASKALKKLTVRHAGAGGESAAFNTKNFTLDVSTGGGVWTTVATVTNNTAATTNHTISANGQWIRITTTDPVARIYEFEAYN